jgi:hypothetical protein
MGHGANDKPDAGSAAAFEDTDLDALSGLLRESTRERHDERRRDADQN